VLSIEDVPNGPVRVVGDDVECPTQERFALQLLVRDDPDLTELPWIGRDAAFKKGSNLAKPSEVLLHYKYGAAAIKCWSRQTHLFASHTDAPRPPAAVIHKIAGPACTFHDRAETIRKRQQRQADTAGSSKRRRSGPRRQIGGPEE
jgi:hypothetical protein